MAGAAGPHSSQDSGGSKVSIKASFYKVLAEFDSQYSGENPRHWAGVVAQWLRVLPALPGF